MTRGRSESIKARGIWGWISIEHQPHPGSLIRPLLLLIICLIHHPTRPRPPTPTRRRPRPKLPRHPRRCYLAQSVAVSLIQVLFLPPVLTDGCPRIETAMRSRLPLRDVSEARLGASLSQRGTRNTSKVSVCLIPMLEPDADGSWFQVLQRTQSTSGSRTCACKSVCANWRAFLAALCMTVNRPNHHRIRLIIRVMGGACKKTLNAI